MQERGLDLAVAEFAHSGRPLLGICLGMQLFATTGEEFGLHSGLNLVPGRVTAIPSKNIEGGPLKLPYIGWTALDFTYSLERKNSIIASLTNAESIYLVHSFHYLPVIGNQIMATYRYGGNRITAAIKKDNVTGLQFHPEKSGPVGLRILSDFIKE